MTRSSSCARIRRRRSALDLPPILSSSGPRRFNGPRKQRRAGNRPAFRLRRDDPDYGLTAGGSVPTPQLLGGVLVGQTSGPPACAAGAIVARALGAGVQPLPSHAASKSTDRRLEPTAPYIDTITQFWLVVREPGVPGAFGPKPARCAVRVGSKTRPPEVTCCAPLERFMYIQPPRSVVPSAGNSGDEADERREASGSDTLPGR